MTARALVAAPSAERGGLRPYGSYRDSGLPWLEQIPAHWEIASLGRLGRLFKGNGGSKADNTEHGLACVRYGELYTRYDSVVRTCRSRIAPERADAYTPVRYGDLLLAASGETIADIGRSAVVLLNEPAVCGGDLIVVRPERQIVSEFLGLASNSAPVQRQKACYATGSTVKHISANDIKKIFIPLPPSDEQQRIASFLEAHGRLTSRLIRNKRRMIGLLNEQRQAIINRAVTRGLNPTAPMKPTGIDWMPEVPAHWEVIPLRHLSTCLDGRRVPLEASARAKMLGEIPYWGANQIIDHLNEFLFDEDLILLGEDGAPFFDRIKPVAFFSQGKVWPNNHIHVLRPKPGNRPEFIVQALNCVDYANYVGGATRDKLTQSYMKAIPIPVPPKDEQDAILDHLKQECTPLERAAERAEREIDLIREYRERLIADVVTGKLDVRHIEIAAPADDPIIDEDDAPDEDLEAEDTDEPAEALD